MAEGILNHMAKEKSLNLSAKSAGIYAYDGNKASTNAILVMNGMGIDINNKKSIQIHRNLLEEADVVLTMSNSHKEELLIRFPFAEEKIFLLNEYAHGINKDIDDPFGRGELAYKKAAEEIYKAIEKIVNNE